MAQATPEVQPAWPEFGSHAPPTEPEHHRFDFLGMLLRRKWLIVFGMLLGTGLGYLFYQQQTPEYASYARLMITPKDSSAGIAMPGMDTGALLAEYRKSRAHDEVIMSTTFVQENVIGNLEGVAASISGLPDPIQLQMIREGLLVIPNKNTPYLYELSFQSEDQEACDEMLSKIVSSYGDYLAKQYKSESAEVFELLKETEGTLKVEFEERERAIADFIKNNLDELALSNGSELVNIAQQHMQEVDSTRRELRRQRSESENMLILITDLIDQGKKSEAVRAIIDSQTSRYLIGNDNQREGFSIAERRVELQLLLQKFGDDHPRVKLLRDEITVLEEQLQLNPLGEISPNRPEEYLSYYTQKLSREIEAMDATLASLDAEFEQHKGDAKALNAAHLTLKGLLDEKQHIQDLRRSLNSQIKNADLSQKEVGFMFELLEPPTLARTVWPDPLKIFAVAAFLGGLAGIGLAYLVDLADKTFRAPDEISQTLHLPIIGHIPYITGGKVDKDPSMDEMHETLFVCHKPKSRLTEAVRGVRTSLFFNNREKTSQVIQVTSPSPSDGKSTLAANLAISIAQAGKRVLLVDADLRRPRQHKLIGEDSDEGFTSVLKGEVAPQEAVLETKVKGLTFLPCGDRPSNPSELLTSPRLQDFIDTVREHYDYVIIDSPPLLAVTDPCVIAPRVDGVILAFRIRKNIRVKADRAREILTAVGSNIVGVVVNGIGGGHSYGDYKYAKYSKAYGTSYYNKYGGYGNGPHGYGYNYGYGYDYSDAEKYYEEEGQPRRKRSKPPATPSA